MLEDALKRGFLDSDEAYQIPGFPGHAAAAEGMQSLYRAARRMNLGFGARVYDETGQQCWEKGKRVEEYCYDPQAPHMVDFRIWSKNSTRAHVLEESGGDPSRLRYNPWARPQKTRVTDDGRVI